jgi:capsular polysaccharide biosynthesis protein
VILPNGEFAGELVALTQNGRNSMLNSESAFRDPLPDDAKKKRGNYCPVLGFGVSHYYHWNHDLIMGMRGAAELLPTDTQLIVPERMKPFQIESLELLGLDGHPRAPFPPGEFWELENLYVFTPRLKTQIDSGEPYRWFRHAAMARYAVDEGEPTRRLYLTRRHDRHWRTTNEPEVESLLSEHGFETVAPGTQSFQEQIELFAQAEFIIGTGAGLFNMVFSPRGTKVLQLQESSHVVHALWTAADAMGFEYYYLFGDSVRNRGGTEADIYVPLEKLEQSLQVMMAK